MSQIRSDPRRRRVALGLAGLGLLLGTLAAPGAVVAVNGGACNRDYNPVISPADFETATGAANAIDNPYFPLEPGTTFLYEGHKEGATLRDVMTVTTSAKTIMGVSITVVHDAAYEDGVLAEDTFDWYAQDESGNVWYFGEDTRELDEDGNVVTTEGSWQAGINGALPGIIMEAHPASGDTYRQEYGIGVAVDMSTVLSLHKHITVPAGSFAHVIETKEFSCIEGGIDHKFYAPGVGLLREVAVAGGDEGIDLVSVTP